MPQYQVTLPADAAGASQTNNRDTFIVSAASAAEARSVAKISSDAKPNAAKWDAATVVELVEGQEIDYAMRMRITFPGDTEPTEFLAPAGVDATFLLLAGSMETLLEANAGVGANVSQVAGPPVVQTIALAAGLGEVEITADLLLDGQVVPAYSSVDGPFPGFPATARVITLVDQSAVDLAKIHAALTADKF